MNLEVKDIERLVVSDGEVLVIHVSENWTAQNAEDLQDMFREALPGVSCLILAGDFKLEVVAKDALPV